MKEGVYYKVIIGLLAIGLIVVLVQNYLILNSVKEFEQNQTKEDSLKNSNDLNVQETAQINPFQPVIDKLLLHEEMQAYNGQNATVIKLDENTLAALKEKYPVIYEGTKAGDYLFFYSNLLVVYDFEEDKILKTFNLQSVEVNPT